jgi:transmembrane sensor
MDDNENQLDRIGEHVRQLMSDDASASDELRRGRSEFLAEVVRRQHSPARAGRSGRRRLLPWALAASVAAATAGVWLWARVQPLSFEVGETSSGQPGQRIEALDGRTVPLSFSDGSSLVLAPGATMRVLSLDNRENHILIEDGALEVRVARRPLRKIRWLFEAGPYHVQVTGTKFQMVFHAALRSLQLSTEEGQVVVSGCQQEPRSVAAGHSIELSCPRNPLPPRSGMPSEVSPRPASMVEAPPTPPRTKSEPSWRELLSSGRAEEALRSAERSNFDRVCQTASARELLTLADTARLSGSYQRAVTALQRLRQRFPRSMDASIAAFTLGRISFEKLHAYGEAAVWFDTYMREQPAGPLMGDSFGRRMEARMRAGDHAQARVDAEQYLRRFPEGPYAAEARTLLSR